MNYMGFLFLKRCAHALDCCKVDIKIAGCRVRSFGVAYAAGVLDAANANADAVSIAAARHHRCGVTRYIPS